METLRFFTIIFLYQTLLTKATTSPNEDDTTSNKPACSKTIVELVPNVKYGKKSDEKFEIYCYENVPKSVFQIWRSVHLTLLNKPVTYELFHGVNDTEVCDNYKAKSFWRPSFVYSSSDSVIDFPAFSQYCVGIATNEQFAIQLQVRTINYWKVLQTILGVFLLLTSPTLSRNAFFHYTSGVSFGVLASLLILLFVVSRFIPKKSASYTLLIFGYSFFLYILKVFWHHFHDILTQHMDIVLGYCVITAFLSFIICYRLGPVKSQRTFNLIQWCMQAVSLLLVFFSSEYRELSTAVILMLLCGRMVPNHWIKWLENLWYRCFPPKIKLLTELGYIEQGNVETKIALENLRQFCSSPDCNVWKVVRRLKDPTRFANFIENGSHYTDQELLEYNSEDVSDDIWDAESGETVQNLIRNGIH